MSDYKEARRIAKIMIEDYPERVREHITDLLQEDPTLLDSWIEDFPKEYEFRVSFERKVIEHHIIDTYNQQHNVSKDYIEINIHS